MNYNSFLSKDYKFENPNSRHKNHNYKLIFIGIVMVSLLLLFYSMYFSNQASIAQASAEPIQNTTLTNSPQLTTEPLLLPSDNNSNLSTSLVKTNSTHVSAPKKETYKDTQRKPIQLNTKTVSVRKKDSMAAIFKRNKLSSRTLHRLVYETKLGKQLTKLKPGQKITFILDQNRTLHSLRLQKNKKQAIVLERDFSSKQVKFSSSIENIASSHAELAKTETQIPPQIFKPESRSTKLNPVKKAIPVLKNVVTTNIVTIKKGDSLAAIFKRNNLDKTTLHHLVHSSKLGKQLTRIRPGQKLVFGFDENKQLVSLHFQKNRIETLVLQRDFSSQNKSPKKSKPVYASYLDKKEVEIRTSFNSGTIQGSFFVAAKNAGLSDAMTMKLAHLFGWDIDFALNIRSGDSFSVLYEEKYLEGEKIANGDIIVAEFVNQGEVFQAIRYTDAGGRTDYYTPEGYSMRKAFLRTPVAFSRISSRFSLGRRHPVLNKIRAHKGVDYAAPRGTPIKATGSGKVIYRGRKGGYGKVVQIRHANKYTTLYAHLSSYNRKVKNGSRVKQGQVIGYVGSTGLATGPHLHYEFRVNGAHRNPLTVKLPNADPINKKYKQDFRKLSNTLLSKLTLEKKQQVASAQ